jgi:plasmid stabilization system protein ParE
MRIRYTLRARGDLEAIFSYLDRRAPSGAMSVKQTIERRIRRLADIPLIAPATTEPGVHELTVLRYPYKVYYSVENDEVTILHVRHSSRKPPDVTKL